MKKFTLILAVFTMVFNANAHTGKPLHHVIVDTDGATDDMRAITLLLAAPRVEVLGITCVDGILPPGLCAEKVVSLLKAYHHEGIPVGTGEANIYEDVQGREFCSRFSWGDNENGLPVEVKKARPLYQEIISNETEPVTMVCLGPLTNVAENLDLLRGHIGRIVWYCSEDMFNEQNYRCNVEALSTVEASGIPLVRISGAGQEPKLDWRLVEDISSLRSIYARHLSKALHGEEMAMKVDSGFFGLWDELCPVFLVHPELFVKSPNGFLKPVDNRKVKLAVLEILDGYYADSRVFDGFPEDSSLFINSIGRNTREIIDRHGRAEWRAGVITNELHGHIGIYAIIGTKMGIRAREYFNIGVDGLRVVSRAGSTPPVSCLNDGIQVSTGASVGHGLIEIDPGIDKPYPEALFTFKDKTIRVRLKKELAVKIRNEVAAGAAKYGLEDTRYWQYIEGLAVKYWIGLSRHDMFDVEDVKSSGD